MAEDGAAQMGLRVGVEQLRAASSRLREALEMLALVISEAIGGEGVVRMLGHQRWRAMMMVWTRIIVVRALTL